MLGTAQVFRVTDDGTYHPILMSSSMTLPEAVGTVNFIVNQSYAFYSNTPEHVRRTGFVTPVQQGLWQQTKSADLAFYEWLDVYPEQMADFLGLMKTLSAIQELWYTFYPTKLLVEKADSAGPMLVDVGEGGGRESNGFLKKHPETSGRLFVQDRAGGTERANVDGGIQRVIHDFFAPQPVVHA